MNTPRRSTLPDNDGWIPLIAAGRMWAKYHPARDKLHFRAGKIEAYYDLAPLRQKASES